MLLVTDTCTSEDSGSSGIHWTRARGSFSKAVRAVDGEGLDAHAAEADQQADPDDTEWGKWKEQGSRHWQAPIFTLFVCSVVISLPQLALMIQTQKSSCHSPSSS